MAVSQLLNSVPPDQLQRFEEKLKRVELAHHDVLIEPGRPIRYVYFPLDCMVSIVTPLENGNVIEAATVGNEGMVGLPLFLGLQTVNTRAICQMAGEALRMTADDFTLALAENLGLRIALGYYTQALIAMLAQGSACNGTHELEKRLARWLLTISDRIGRESFTVTQDFLAQMLGAHRPSVTNAAGPLQAQGLISYQHGKVEIVDHDGLKAVACECYDLIRQLYQETFRQIPATIAKIESTNGH